jgi:D-alanyl-D-alanine carboxypeptidase (penicillin-binding protein 5/6)
MLLAGGIVCLAIAIACPSYLFFYNQKEKNTAYCTRYETATFTKSLQEDALFASSLCVGTDKALEYATFDSNWDEFHEAALFDVEHARTLYAERVFERLYPASTTKLMTAYVALKYGNLDDIVVVGRNATLLEQEAVLCGLREGDRISLYDLLCGLILYSGNDNGVAIAEHISGSVEGFAQLMNEEAWKLGATNSHFLNPHGLHEEEHYTTAYDLYLILNACIQDSRFVEIASMPSYTGTMTAADGSVRHGTWTPTNHYTRGSRPSPEGIRVVGGKTGTTNEAGSCLLLYSVTSNSSDGREHPFISVVMGAPSKPHLYAKMDVLLGAAVSSTNGMTNAESSSGVDSPTDDMTNAESSSGVDPSTDGT